MNLCAGGLGEALRPPVGGLGGNPPIWVFPKQQSLLLKPVTLHLGMLYLAFNID